MARNSEESQGRTMIIMGAGICQWFHGDATYRAVLALLMLTGSMGRNGGGWAHYVGQEKCRPVTGWATLAMATDWQRPPRQMIGTAYWYTHTDQWRYDGYRADALTSPLARGHLAGMHTIDTIALSARLGWMPSYPQFDRNPLDVADEAVAAGQDVAGLRGRPAARRGRCGSRSRTRTRRRTGRAASRCGGRTCSGPRPRATSTSSGTCSARTTTCGRADPARPQAPRRRLARRGAPRRASSTCCCRWTSG